MAAVPAAALLGPLLQGQTNLSGSASVPWQHTSSEKPTGDSTIYFKTWTLDEIPGLAQQCRGALFTSVDSVRIRIKKIPGIYVVYRAFVCAASDLTNDSDPSIFVLNHPGAEPQYTLDKDTTQSSLDFNVDWLLGLGTSVAYVQPPLRAPRLVVFIESQSSFNNRLVSITISGQVQLSGYGYVAGTTT